MIVLISILFVFAFFIGLLMELYKKRIRKDKALDWENWIAAFVLSSVAGCIFYGIAMDADAFSALPQTSLMVIPSTLIIYILQRPACMSFWKPLLKKWMRRKLR